MDSPPSSNSLRSEAEPPAAGAHPQPCGERKTGAPSPEGCVWVVDDSRLDAQHLCRQLEPHFSVLVFADGAEMLERLSALSELPDVLLLDWQLPGPSGPEVCRFVRASRDALALPILMLTVRGAKADFVEGLSAGANDYLTKPYDAQELLVRVRTLVHLRRLHARVRRAEEEQRQRAGFEQQLIGIVSHDLRNPLAAIRLEAQMLLRRSREDEMAGRSASRILGAAERASRMIRDLLDFTQARLGGGIPVVPSALDLHAHVRQVFDEVQALYPDRRVQLEQQGDARGEWDPDRISQVLTNLLTNALQYSPAGSPVTVRTRGEGDAVLLEVHNEGPPIVPEVRHRLFEPLQRGAGRVDPASRSVGLGLYIVHQLARAHGGRVEVSSSAEQGTVFRVTLPRQASLPGRGL